MKGNNVIKTILLALVALTFAGMCSADEKDLREQAKAIAARVLIADTHIDVPYRLQEKPDDITVSTEGGDFDYPRAVEGGLNAVFMSIYTPASYETRGLSKSLADTLINMVEGFAVVAPDRFELASTVRETKGTVSGGKIALILGMENGAPIDGDLKNLEYFFDRGVRYITLTHSKDNHICDSSYDDRRTWRGLSPFGRVVVTEMNRLGIMVDVSHVSDDAFYEIMEITEAPVLASHSSCRTFTPGFERNMSDDMIVKLAKNGGVIQINFGSTFIKDESRRQNKTRRDHVERYARAKRLSTGSKEIKAYKKKYYKDHPIVLADVTDVADHIDHVVRIAGIDYVGLGSDFDGVGETLPEGLKDVSQYPNLIYELLVRGYTEDDIEKICSRNLFRVWEDVERVAARAARE